jgi:hypothetical protein
MNEQRAELYLSDLAGRGIRPPLQFAGR